VEVIKGSSRFGVLMKNLVVFPKAIYVAQLVRGFGAHHIHAHWASVPATMALVVSRLIGVPWSFTAHRWDIVENNLLRIKVQAARFARVISLHGRNEILDIIGKQACPTLFTIHMGTTLPEDVAIPCVKSARQFSIGCIANLVEVKGHRYLIEACGLLRKRGCRFVCHVVGDGPLRGDLETLVREHGLRERVNFLGPLPHDEVIRMLREREIDLVVLPSIETATSEHEGIPVALMEALAYRVPAISTESGGIPELLGGGAGVLVKPADPEALADAIQRVVEDSDYRATLIETGFARVSADFNVRTVAERLAALMEVPGGIG
jgi:glycosyltransferase involved in cell wall biosynthesis